LYRKLGKQIRGHVKPNSIKKLFLTSLEIPGEDELWCRIKGKDAVEEHLIERNVEQFSHASKTPFGYTALGKEIGHTGDSPMADDIYVGVLEHEARSDPVIQAIVCQLKNHPLLENIIKPVVTEEDFKSAFKYIPKKTDSSPSGRGLHYYKACAEGSTDGLSDILCEVYAAMMTVPLETGYCLRLGNKRLI
jgi:hypothetical protein